MVRLRDQIYGRVKCSANRPMLRRIATPSPPAEGNWTVVSSELHVDRPSSRILRSQDQDTGSTLRLKFRRASGPALCTQRVKSDRRACAKNGRYTSQKQQDVAASDGWFDPAWQLM